jgi:hypothetical protein
MIRIHNVTRETKLGGILFVKSHFKSSNQNLKEEDGLHVTSQRIKGPKPAVERTLGRVYRKKKFHFTSRVFAQRSRQ